MPNDFDDGRPPPSGVEKMINALDEVRDAVDRLAAQSRAAAGPTGHDLALEEPFSREEPQPQAQAPSPTALIPEGV